MKLWGGRFEKTTDKLTDEFNASINVDCRMYRQDIQGSIAHANMLAKCGIIPAEDAALITKGLQDILSDIEADHVEFTVEAEDIHMNIEKLLIERIGEAGKRLHTARSRNDQVALDLRMYIRDDIADIVRLLLQLETSLLNGAEKYVDVVIPGYTHLQKAQPTTLGHHYMAYSEMFKRDIQRFLDCNDRVDVMPLGSCAMAGTTYPIDRAMVAGALGFSGVTQNSIDGVADRDFALEFAGCCSIAMMHFSRFCEELVIWSTGEFGFVEPDDAFSTGSSIMPQKKNPDIAELIRGKTGRVYGDLITLLTMMKGLPLAYNKDLQEDKEAVFDASDTLKQCISVFIPMFDSLKVNENRITASLKTGFLNATDAADYLVGKGIAFRDAHEVIGKMVLYCIENGKCIEELKLAEFKAMSPLFEKDIYEFVDLRNCVARRSTPGGPSNRRVLEAIQGNRQYFKQISDSVNKLVQPVISI